MEVVMLMMTYIQKYALHKDVNVKEFIMTTRINKVETLIKHIACNCKCKFDIAACCSDQKWNNDKMSV